MTPAQAAMRVSGHPAEPIQDFPRKSTRRGFSLPPFGAARQPCRRAKAPEKEKTGGTLRAHSFFFQALFSFWRPARVRGEPGMPPVWSTDVKLKFIEKLALGAGCIVVLLAVLMAGWRWAFPPLADQSAGGGGGTAQATADASTTKIPCDKNLVMTAGQLRQVAARCGWSAAQPAQPKPTASPASTVRQNYPGCPVISPSASSAEMRATSAQCGRAADDEAAATEARLAAQSERAWSEQQKRDEDALASIGVPPATTAAGTVVAAVPAMAGTAALPPPTLTPPPGVRPELVTESVQARDQFDQWVTLDHRVVPAPTLALTTSPSPAGATGTRRTVWRGWIKLARPAATVALHVAGGSVRVSAKIDSWAVALNHSDAWTTAPSEAQQVITLAKGWHLVTIEADQFAGTQPANVELQIGSANVDPVIPVPWAAPASAATAVKPSAGATVGGSRAQGVRANRPITETKQRKSK